jgi:hypothetical protein
MSSPIRAPTTPSNSLPAQLEQIGLHAVADEVDDFLARATKQRWSPRQILEHLAQPEVAERAHRSLERRLRLSEIKKFKLMADFDWFWPTRIERDVIERALALDFLPAVRNLIGDQALSGRGESEFENHFRWPHRCFLGQRERRCSRRNSLSFRQD